MSGYGSYLPPPVQDPQPQYPGIVNDNGACGQLNIYYMMNPSMMAPKFMPFSVNCPQGDASTRVRFADAMTSWCYGLPTNPVVLVSDGIRVHRIREAEFVPVFMQMMMYLNPGYVRQEYDIWIYDELGSRCAPKASWLHEEYNMVYVQREFLRSMRMVGMVARHGYYTSVEGRDAPVLVQTPYNGVVQNSEFCRVLSHDEINARIGSVENNTQSAASEISSSAGGGAAANITIQ